MALLPSLEEALRTLDVLLPVWHSKQLLSQKLSEKMARKCRGPLLKT